MEADLTFGRSSFERAAREYELVDIPVPVDAVAVASESLARTGLFLLGERHGVAQTPSAIFSLAASLGVRALAFEWAHDELDPIVQRVLATGTFDIDALWSLPPSAEAFSGDGRFTAGHVRLLERLAADLDRVVLLDRVGSQGAERDAGMAARLLAARRRDSAILAVLGAAHVAREPFGGLEPVGLLVTRKVPGVANGCLVVTSDAAPAVDVIVSIGAATPAVVPR